MKQDNEPSIIAKGERAIDDFLNLWKRRKLICCILIGGFLVAPIIAVFEHFYGIPTLEEKNADLSDELSDTKRERDTLKTQLAPWQALAASIYTNAPPDKRLDLLLGHVERIESEVREVSKRIPIDRVITADAVKEIQRELKASKSVSVAVDSYCMDGEALRLRAQVEDLFRNVGFPIKRPGMYLQMGGSQKRGISVRMAQRLFDGPNLMLKTALNDLLLSLNEELTYQIDEKLSDSEIVIEIGCR